MLNIIDLLDLLTTTFPGYTWTTPKNLDWGILTTNQAFLQAKSNQENPVKTASQIADKLNQFFQANQQPYQANTAGPYVNLDLQPEAYQKLVTINQSTVVKLQPIHESFVIDMFHPNVGKKMHVGHIRSGNLGESMRRILSLKYDRVISDSYLGDWGIQFSYITWGILHLDKLQLDFTSIDLDAEDQPTLIDKFYKIYVKINQLIEEQPAIRLECQKNSKLLEAGLQGQPLDPENSAKFEILHKLYKQIVTISLTQFREGELFLNLNRNPDWLDSQTVLIEPEKIARVQGKTGCHYAFSQHNQTYFNLTLGESFYISFLSEIQTLADYGLATREGEAIYVDLTEENLGRAYLISSEGYSLYLTRDVICRIVYAGIFGFDNAITFADLRQKHSFDQLFAVLRRIIKSQIYTTRPFGWLTQEETNRAMQILAKKMAMFEGFGYFSLPEGAMSTRKGKIFAFEDLKEILETKVRQTLIEKHSPNPEDPEKIRKICVATLKWVDLHRDRELDVVFDPNQFLKFEGNTGVYQLYTVVRLKSILKQKTNLEVKPDEFQANLLKPEELELLKRTFVLPLILEAVCHSYKPHYLCNYLFDLAVKINRWYGLYSVTHEADLNRKNSLLVVCQYLLQHLEFCLSLLGIETVEEI